VHPLSRYLLRRHLAPFGLALAGITSLMLMNQVAKQLPGLRGKGLPGSVIIEVFVLSVPFIVAVVLPMAVLIAVLRVFTRFAADHEITTAQGDGVSARRLITPVLGGAACISALLFVWNDQILPRANHRLHALQVDIQRQPFVRTDYPHKSEREMTVGELRRAAQSAREEGDRAMVDGLPAIEQAARRRAATYAVEIQKKYAIAAACLFFALFGAPLGLRADGRGASVVIATSVVVFIVYYVGLIGGEDLANDLVMSPFLAMWPPNLIVGGLGLVVLWSIRKRAYAAPRDRSVAQRGGQGDSV
jgi:lipopolysaccharide export LptBFGC system permease protein LptF